MKRILITGSNGLLGQKLIELLTHSNSHNLLLCSKQEHSVFPEDTLLYRQLDIMRKQDVRKVVDEFEPQVIVNTAAITNVDQCEKERELAWRTNVSGVENLLHVAKLVGAHFIQLSTDYVFDGKNGPYDELARPNPLCYYGKTKLAAENLVRTCGIPYTIIRTMVLYGVGFGIKVNFALWVLQNLTEGRPVRVVDDQLGNPTLADDLAYAIHRIIELERTELYHISGADLVSRYDFALALARLFGFSKKLIIPIKTSALKQPAPRPMKSGFITLKAETELGIKISGVEHGLTVFKNQIQAHVKQYAEDDR